MSLRINIMQPFDLEKAKAGQPVVCRDGTPARLLMHLEDAQPSQRVLYQTSRGTVYSAYENGKYQAFGESPLDLCLAGDGILPEIDFWSIWMKTSNHVEYGREIERIVREQCAKEKNHD